MKFQAVPQNSFQFCRLFHTCFKIVNNFPVNTGLLGKINDNQIMENIRKAALQTFPDLLESAKCNLLLAFPPCLEMPQDVLTRDTSGGEDCRTAGMAVII
jgi:hypothetical protein